MKFEYRPSVLNLTHPFRYINGILIKGGHNDLNDTDYKQVANTETFQSLIDNQAIIFETKKTPKRKPTEAVVIATTPPVVEEKTITTTTEEFGKIPYKEALAIIDKTTSIDTLLQYQASENANGVRVKVLKVIEGKLSQLGQ